MNLVKTIFIFSFSIFYAGDVFSNVFGRQLKMDGLRFEINNFYHYQTATFNEDGETETIDADNNFYLIDSSLVAFWGLTESITLLGGGGIRYVASESSSESVTNTNLEHFMLGARIQFKDLLSMMGNFEIRFKQKAYTNNFFGAGLAPSDDLVLGNDGIFYHLGLNLTKQLGESHLIQLKSAYVITPSYLSDQLDYDVQYLFQGSNFNLGFGLLGIFSLKNHPFSENPNQRPSVSRGVTKYFNGVNQQELSPYAQLGFRVGGLDITTRASKTLSGVDTDEAFRFYVNLALDFDGVDASVDRDSIFKEYTNSAKIIQVAPRGNFFKINQGLSTSVEKGMSADIYQSDFFGGNVLVGSGVVFSSETDSSVVKVIKFYQKIPIKEGFIVRFK